MAHLDCYTREEIGRVSKEAYREYKNKSAYKNCVDLSKSYLNYSMNGLDRNGFLMRLDARCIEVMQGKEMQSQTKVVGSWMHTVPDEIKGDPVREKDYFKKCFSFDKERYGAENVIDAVVHYDESTPHMTVYICTACVSRKTGAQTISKASKFTRSDLQSYHPALDAYLEQEMGQKGLAMNGRTKGGLTLEELKERTAWEEQQKAREAESQEKEDYLNNVFFRLGKLKHKQDAEKKAAETAQNERSAILDQREAKIPIAIQNGIMEQSKALQEKIEQLEKLYDDEEKRLSTPYIGSQTSFENWVIQKGVTLNKKPIREVYAEEMEFRRQNDVKMARERRLKQFASLNPELHAALEEEERKRNSRDEYQLGI